MEENTREGVCFAKIVKIFEVLLFPQNLACSIFSLNVFCMKLYLKSSEFGFCLVGSGASGVKAFT